VCPVCCAHCNFASPTRRGDKAANRVARHPARVIDFVNTLGSWKVVLSGGGEPMSEPDFVHQFIAEVRPLGLREIEIITSGMFGGGNDSGHAVRELTRTFAGRPDAATLAFKLRLSVDRFHADRIGLDPIVRIIETACRPGLDTVVGVYIRSVLIEGDETIDRLAARLAATLTPLIDFQQQLILPNGTEIPVYYKNLIVDGRMSWKALQRSGLQPHPAALAPRFVQRFLDPSGRHVPARTYNGPTVKHLAGLALIVEHDGAVKILEGNAPDRVPSLFTHNWDECLDYLYADPLTILLIEEGPLALAELLKEDVPGALSLLAQTNQLYYLADKLLADPMIRLAATGRTLHAQAGAGRMPLTEDRLADIDRRIAEVLTGE
jgi:hypothetical protein